MTTSVVNVKVAHIRPRYHDLREWCAEPDHVYIGRRSVVFVGSARYPVEESPFANPFKISKTESREAVILKYRDHIGKKIEAGEVDLETLRGKILGCWCKPEACHGDVLLELLDLASKEAEEQGGGKSE